MKLIKNPWHQSHNACSREYFKVNNPAYSYNGVDVYRISNWEFLYCRGDKALTLRAGMSKAKEIIDNEYPRIIATGESK